MTVFRFIDARRAEHSIKVMCRVLEVSRSGFHAWTSHGPSMRALADGGLSDQIAVIHAASKRTYGSPRVLAELRLADRVMVGRKRVERLTRLRELSGLRKPRRAAHKQTLFARVRRARAPDPAPDSRFVTGLLRGRRCLAPPIMPATELNPADQSDLHQLIGPIWRRKWLLLAIVILSTAGTYEVSARHAKRYHTSTQVFIANSQIAAILGGGISQGTDRTTSDQANLLLSKPVTQSVIQQLHLRLTPNALLATITATPVTGSDLITVTTVASSGAEAAAVANAYVQQYITVSRVNLTVQAQAAIAQLRHQLAILPNRTSNIVERQSLNTSIRQLQAVESSAPTQNLQTAPAVAPTIPFTPRPKRDAAFALAIALALGLALVFVLERFDRRITDIEEVSKVYGIPLLSVIPHAGTPLELDGDLPAVPGVLREPFRSLRTNLRLAALEKPIKRILVASAIAGEGKSTVVRNLALTYREAGVSVVIVEADTRRPTLAAAFAVSAEAGGLTSVLIGDTDLDDALIEIHSEAPSLAYLDKVGAATGAASSRLMLLLSGPKPPNPQAVLESAQTRKVLDQLSERFDIVIIDTPPLLVVSDALPLLAQADGVILVTRLAMTERPAAQRAVAAAQLDPSVRLLGVVANDVATQPGQGYGYGYGYGRGYGSGND